MSNVELVKAFESKGLSRLHKHSNILLESAWVFKSGSSTQRNPSVVEGEPLSQKIGGLEVGRELLEHEELRIRAKFEPQLVAGDSELWNSVGAGSL